MSLSRYPTIEVFSRDGKEVMGSQGPGQFENVVEDDGQVPCSVDSADVVPIQILSAEERSEIYNPIPNPNHLYLLCI